MSAPPPQPAEARAIYTGWMRVSMGMLPFADAATQALPISRLLRLSLFQVSVGMALALTVGTLNRVMIVELGVSATLVAIMVALPILSAPFRALIGFRSDTHRSALGWRRVPYIWYGTLLQFGGLSIMPFSLLVLSGDNNAPVALGQAAAALAFLLVGIGVQTTQTAGLALATDLATPESRPRVVALMYVMLLVGMTIASIAFSALLVDFSPMRLIQVVQGAALLTMLLNITALWKQEARDRSRTAQPDDDFTSAWRDFIARPQAVRFLVALALGTAAFGMQDVLLEPYGGDVLGLDVSQTSLLTGLFVGGSLLAFALAARLLGRGMDPYRLAGYGAVLGLPGFSAVICAAPFDSALLFRLGTVTIGFGAGLFAVAMLTAATGFQRDGRSGLALGAWGAVQASTAGGAIMLGGILRDGVAALAEQGWLGPGMMTPATSYGAVYHLELFLLFATLVAIGPLVRYRASEPLPSSSRFGLSNLPS